MQADETQQLAEKTSIHSKLDGGILEGSFIRWQWD